MCIRQRKLAIVNAKTASIPQTILIVTGVSGAGKTTVLKALEDLVWEAVDNFPIRLAGQLIDDDALIVLLNDVIQRTHPVGYNRPVWIPADSSVVSFHAIGILHSRWRTGFAFRINQVGVVPPL